MPTIDITGKPLSPQQMAQWRKTQRFEANRARDPEIAGKALKMAQSIITEWSQRQRPLLRRWRATWHMLAGNTLERNGPEDVHVPEIHKAMETMVPRLEEIMLDHDPWFRAKPRRAGFEREAEANAAYLDWQFEQSNIRSLIQPAIRDMLVTQVGVFYTYWDVRERWRTKRDVKISFDEHGERTKTVELTREKVVDYCGPRSVLVDPVDFIIAPRATNPQDAVYVGHRAWMPLDEIQRLGKQFGWQNLDNLTNNQSASAMAPEVDVYKWARDPSSRMGDPLNRITRNDGRPEPIEIFFLYVRMSFDDNATIESEFDDYVIVVANKTVLEVRPNENDEGLRPYATMRSSRNGHNFFGVGPFDNAIRLNQYLDSYHQTFLRLAKLAAGPFVFAEEESDLPDSLHNTAPFKVFTGTGPIRFSQVPDGALRAAPLVLNTLQKNIEEVVGSFRINMGQETGGTATESSLALQEGNRRMRAYIRSIGECLDQLLRIYNTLNNQYSTDEIEFPVLGKRALDLHTTHLKVGPETFLPDLAFDLVGLHGSRNYGLKATMIQNWVNAMQAFIVANPNAVDQNWLLYNSAREMIGPDEADQIVKTHSPRDRLKAQSEENNALVQGIPIEVDPDDDDAHHLRDDVFQVLVREAMDPTSRMGKAARRVILEHYENHKLAFERKQAQEKALAKRMPANVQPTQPTGSPRREPPKPGGFPNAMMDLAMEEPPGQTPGETPGPILNAQTPRTGRRSRSISQQGNYGL